MDIFWKCLGFFPVYICVSQQIPSSSWSTFEYFASVNPDIHELKLDIYDGWYKHSLVNLEQVNFHLEMSQLPSNIVSGYAFILLS